MPIITTRVAATRTTELTRAIVEGLVERTTRLLGKDPAVTAVVVDYVDPALWFIAGKPLTEHGLASMHVEITITDETNTKAEKAAWMTEVFTLFEGLLGGLHEESYLHVHDVRAAAYGYGGRTQEYRYQHPVR